MSEDIRQKEIRLTKELAQVKAQNHSANSNELENSVVKGRHR